ncbi:LacI family transcriptional regulator [Ktedonosporobacter rubrisoli]|uniref:LacI family transcriptional regulator n=1 Tax=Ktedonosporobacter rubrisoli TaxID=2509675 RepID=A0A4P6K4J5_KTERU|nr:LacI family DNA-binding transcriptional regulator [Ktedonosporobacter rubrisoli]QBD82853.1 LacI family transcriptional regulator [Ktedonosporobacter rubrisoli]
MRVTIEDVARAAGVSRSTVSLVLRGSTEVAEETRKRVREVMTQLGYQHNRLAASLRSKHSYILGLVVSDISYPPYGQIAVGVEAAIEDAGYSLIVANSHENVEREQRHINMLRQYSIDGLCLNPVNLSLEGVAHLQALQKSGFPLVTLYREVEGLEADFCGTDVYRATRQLVSYLAGELGHRRIAILSGRLSNTTNPLRIQGWRDELCMRNLPADDDLLVICSGSTNGDEAGVQELLARNIPFTAVICVNDYIALCAMRMLPLAGKRVPEDISIASMGGFSQLSTPGKSLTAITEDYYAIGREAGKLLLQRITGTLRGGPERRILPTRLYAGQTTGAPVQTEIKS